MEKFYSTGRRKRSTARVFIKLGTGKIIINKKKIKYYMNNNLNIIKIIKPLQITNVLNKLNLYITVKGGGIQGQSEAIRHGISRVLVKYNENYKKILRKYNFITRDSREVERKKVGFKKSRKKPQFSKR